MLARGMVSVALPLVATVPCSWVKVKVSAVLVFLTATKWKLDLVASNSQRAATDGATLLLELLELLGAMLLELLLTGVLPLQLAPLSVKAVGTWVLGLFTTKPNCALALVAKLPL